MDNPLMFTDIRKATAFLDLLRQESTGFCFIEALPIRGDLPLLLAVVDKESDANKNSPAGQKALTEVAEMLTEADVSVPGAVMYVSKNTGDTVWGLFSDKCNIPGISWSKVLELYESSQSVQ